MYYMLFPWYLINKLIIFDKKFIKIKIYNSGQSHSIDLTSTETFCRDLRWYVRNMILTDYDYFVLLQLLDNLSQNGLTNGCLLYAFLTFEVYYDSGMLDDVRSELARNLKIPHYRTKAADWVVRDAMDYFMKDNPTLHEYFRKEYKYKPFFNEDEAFIYSYNKYNSKNI